MPTARRKWSARWSKLDGVDAVNVSFMTQRMSIDADETRFDEIMDNVVKTCRKIEPDCKIVR